MTNQTRMLKVLGSLASAMLLTSLLLSWLEPGLPLAAAQPSVRELAEASVAVVREPSAIEHRRWQTIEIIPGPASSLTAARLSAIPDATGSHFVIDDHGRIAGLRPWRAQAAAAEAPGAVRIRVSRVDRNGPMTQPQWLAVQALVSALNRELGSTGDSLPVTIEDTWARSHGLAEGAILRIPADPSEWGATGAGL